LEAREKQQRGMQAQLDEARRLEALGRLAGGVAHEFNNLLGAIVGYARFIAEDVPADTAGHRHADRILAAGRRGERLVGRLLAFARRHETSPTRFDLAEGQARSRALVLDTGAFAVTGRGGIDLAAERVNLAFDTETSEPSLASLAVPFKVIGPLADPAVVPDPVGAALGAVGTVGNVAESGANIVGGAVNTVGDLVGPPPAGADPLRAAGCWTTWATPWTMPDGASNRASRASSGIEVFFQLTGLCSRR